MMSRSVTWPGGLILGVGLLLAAQPAQALIAVAIPLRDVLGASQFIILAKIELLDPDKPAMMMTVEEDLKGKASFRKLPVNLTGDSDAKKLQHTAQLLKRLAADLPLVVFVNQKDKQYTAFGYTNGTWFQFIGRKADDDDTIRWSFTHCEPALRGTFKGTTAEMKQVVADGLANKKAPPPPDTKEKPGLGPELKDDKKPNNESEADLSSCHLVILSSCHVFSPGDPLLAVIPSVLVGGPLAILAMLFPAVFGGLILVLRRWMAALTVVSLNSTIYMLYGWAWFQERIAGTWLNAAPTLWLLMTLLSLAGALWAWRRHLAVGQQDPAAASGPGRREHLVLWALSLAAGGVLAYYGLVEHQSLLAFPLKGVLVLGSGIWGATLYTLLLRLTAPADATARAFVPLEGVSLVLMVCAALLLTTSAARVGARGLEIGETSRPLPREVWKFQTEDRGSFNSSPLVAGNRVYVGAAMFNAFNPEGYGIIYCLDRATGKRLWAYNEDNSLRMKPVFSTPCLANGRLFVGEGFHRDVNCKLYCLKAETANPKGELLWSKQTGSHTESSPCVADGRLFFGAGDDGLYCLDATADTEKELWHYQHELHIDANPVVVDGRLYCGGGVVGEAAYKRSAIFCLDVATKEEIWLKETDLPVMGAPVVAGDHVFFPMGNGNFSESEPSHPQGACLCVEAKTGQKVWRQTVGDSVLTRPVVDKESVYFGARDGFFYCVARRNGQMRWKQGMGSPVVASPALITCPHCGKSDGVYVAASDGLIACLEPSSGQFLWRFQLDAGAALPPQVYSSPALLQAPATEGERRSLFLGAGLLHDATSSIPSNAVLYCYEEKPGAE